MYLNFVNLILLSFFHHCHDKKNPFSFFRREALGTRVNPDTCRIRVDGQIRFECEHLWMWKFFNPERKSSEFKNMWTEP